MAFLASDEGRWLTGQNIGAGQAVAFLTPRAEPRGVICIGRTEEE